MLSGIFARYGALLRTPGLGATFALTWFARLPVATVTLAMLFHVRDLTGSFAAAGAATGAYLVAGALTAPAIGRFIDRNGPRLALAATGIACPLGLFLILAARPLGLDASAIWALAALAGAFMPPITTLTRTSLRHQFPDERDRATLFALDTVLIETAFTLGPLGIAVLLATGGPALAYAAACAVTLLAAPAFAASPAMRHLRRERDVKRRLLGPLTEPGLLSVYLVVFLTTFTFGLVEVAYPAFGAAQGTPTLGAVLIAVNSLGSAIGGLTYGGMPLRVAPARQLPAILALMVAPLALQGLLPGPWLLALLAFAAGLLIAPALTVVMLLVSARAASHYATEAFTWATSCIVAGIGAGAALGGRLVDSHGPAAPFLVAATSVALAAIASGLGRRR